MQATLGITEIEPGTVQEIEKEEMEYLHPLIAARLIVIAKDPRRLHEIGSAIALLSYIVRACGAEDHCTIKIRHVAAQCHTAEVTVRKWGTKLKKLGIITREPMGNSGVKITLVDPAIRTSAQLHADRASLIEAKRILDALAVTVCTAFQSTTMRLQHQLNLLSGEHSG